MSSTADSSVDLNSSVGGQGMLNIGTMARKRIAAKRKRKGLGE
jgi:hypothetical protein